MKFHIITLKKMEIELPTDDPSKFLGKGSFGHIYLSNDRKKALKIIRDVNQITNGKQYQQVAKAKLVKEQILGTLPTAYETKLSSMFDHPNILKTYGWFTTKVKDNTKIGVELELMNISLDKLLYSGTKQRLTYEEKKSICCQLFSAVHYLGQLGIVHRDIKPSNILINDRGMIKLSDLGAICPASLFEDKKIDYNSAAGTVNYKPPEFLIGENGYNYSNSFDVWSAGVTMIEIFTSSPRFASVGKIVDGTAVNQPTGVLVKIMKCFPVKDRVINYKGEDTTGLEWFNKKKGKVPYSAGDDRLKLLMDGEVKGVDDDERKLLEDFLVNNIFIFDESKRKKDYINHPYLAKYKYVKQDVATEKGKVKKFVASIDELMEKYAKPKWLEIEYQSINNNLDVILVKKKNSNHRTRKYIQPNGERTNFSFKNDGLYYFMGAPFYDDFKKLISTDY